MDAEKILSSLVRVGIVSSIDAATRRVRVQFPDLGITSGWLFVVQHYQAGVYVAPNGEHSHEITGGGDMSTEADHAHPGSSLTYWMPKVGSKVLALYLPVFNGDGFILGGI